MHNLIDCSQRIRQKPLSADTNNYVCHLLLCSQTDSKFYISPPIAAPFTQNSQLESTPTVQ